MESFFEKTPHRLLLLIPFFLLSIMLVMNHEPWRDEIANFMLATQTGHLFTMLKIMLTRTDHGPLWYIMMHLTSLVHPSFAAAAWMHAAVMMGAMVIMALCAPFRWYEKLLISLGYLVLYEYNIIVRNYGIVVLLFFALAALYPVRFKKPFLFAAILGLCGTAHPIPAIGAGILFLVFVYEGRKHHVHPAAYAVTALLFAFALLYILPIHEQGAASGLAADRGLFRVIRRVPSPETAWIKFKGIFNLVFFILPRPAPGATHFSAEHPGHSALMALLFLALTFIVAPRRKGPAIYFWTSSVMIFAFLLVRTGGIRHMGFLFINLLFSLWLDRENREQPVLYTIPRLHAPRIRQIAFAAILGLQAWSGLIAAWMDLQYPFSLGRETADAVNKILKEGKPENTLIATFYSMQAETMMPFIRPDDFAFYSIEYEKDYRMMGLAGDWQKVRPEKVNYTFQDILGRFLKEASRGGYDRAYLVLPFPLRPTGNQLPRTVPISDEWSLQLVYYPEQQVVITSDEKFFIYALKKNAATAKPSS